MHSRGVGSDNAFSEEDVYKHKDLSLIKVDALPKDAAQFRSWKNAFVTRVCAIDRTGADTLLRWLLPAFETAGDVNLSNPQGLPRFDAHLASLLADPKHLRNKLGLQLQGYIEGCQLQYTAPRGRVLLNMVARRFFLDQRRGANLTEQALLELQLDTFSYQSLLAFANRVEYILNSIPPEHQPSEQTKFTWLFGRLKKCRLLQRHVDRIKDAREGSRVRTWDWLFSKLKRLRNKRKRKGETVPRVARWPIPNMAILNLLRPESQRPRLQVLEKVIPQAKAQGKARKEGKGKEMTVVPKVLQTNRHLPQSMLSPRLQRIIRLQRRKLLASSTQRVRAIGPTARLHISVPAKPSPVTQVPLPRLLLLPLSRQCCLPLPAATPLATTASQLRRVGLVVTS